jgi:hypothetical protein
MGNIWMFPYRVGAFEGTAFLIPYIICVAVIGFTGVMGEIAFGRVSGAGAIGAFGKALESKGKRKLGEAIGLKSVRWASPSATQWLWDGFCAISSVVLPAWRLRRKIPARILARLPDTSAVFYGSSSDLPLPS